MFFNQEQRSILLAGSIWSNPRASNAAASEFRALSEADFKPNEKRFLDRILSKRAAKLGMKPVVEPQAALASAFLL